MSTRTSSAANTATTADVNLAIVRGRLAAEPDLRPLPGGTTVAHLDVVTDLGTVPVAWHEPRSATLAALPVGVELLVVGRVARRFFRSGGRTLGRTEVVADRVVPTRRAAHVRRAIEAVIADLTR
jgi:hypothetical protein